MIMILIMLVACTANEDPLTEDGNDIETEESARINQIAEEFISLLAEGQFEEASRFGDDTIKADDLKSTWDTLQQQIGDMVEQEYSTTTELNGLDVVMITGHFEQTEVMFNISFNQENQIAGFYVQ